MFVFCKSVIVFFLFYVLSHSVMRWLAVGKVSISNSYWYLLLLCQARDINCRIGRIPMNSGNSLWLLQFGLAYKGHAIKEFDVCWMTPKPYTHGWMNVLNRNTKTGIIFPRVDWKVEIPFPKIVKTLPWNYKELHYKEKPYRES